MKDVVHDCIIQDTEVSQKIFICRRIQASEFTRRIGISSSHDSLLYHFLQSRMIITRNDGFGFQSIFFDSLYDIVSLYGDLILVIRFQFDEVIRKPSANLRQDFIQSSDRLTVVQRTVFFDLCQSVVSDIFHRMLTARIHFHARSMHHDILIIFGQRDVKFHSIRSVVFCQGKSFK